MISFRPHKLQVTTFETGGFDELGRPLPDVESVVEVPCRIVPNGSAAQVRFNDGKAYNFSYSIYLDQDCRAFATGEKVRLIGLDGEVENDKQFEVLGFMRNQLNARLWV
ncbi:MAG: hypothetical protein IKO85_05000 [Bacteroidaceae bacterium]|nr:hypothetical protein [Bacteroidaceae bacterium]